jgi:hypothetical protein
MYLTVTKPVREAKAQLWAVVPLMMMMMHVDRNERYSKADIVFIHRE